MRISDGCLYRVLSGLMRLDGERLSYRTLDVEQIGSVYETVMGFTVEPASGSSLAIRAGKNNKTPVFVSLETLVLLKAEARIKALKEDYSRGGLTSKQAEAIKQVGRLVQANMNFLAQVTSVQQIAAFRVIEQFKAAFEGYGDDEILAALNQIRDGAAADGQAPIKVAEFDRLAQGDPQIGRNDPSSRFYAETLPRRAWHDGRANGRFIRNVVAVHRLREVSALYGFTRLEPAPTQDDGELEDIRLAVSGAPLAKETSWLPAIEQLGEGLFLHFDEGEIQAWISRPEVKERASAIQVAHDKWWEERQVGSDAPPAPSVAYVLLHTLSHALLTQIALDCGYPASSLKERIYAISGSRGGAPERCGILIYTASPGAQGSLGGLAGVAPRVLPILDQALEAQLICSSDPVCADHVPGEGGADRSLLGAACHGCQLIAETSCEARNLYLDRNLIVPTMALSSALPLFEIDD
jgi:hypothetical protein